LLDVEVPGVDTFALLRWMSANHPATRVLMLSGFVLPALIERSLDDGAAGYIHKDATPDAVVDCIRRAIEGEIVLSEAARDVVRGAAWQ
jgi:DNA-binding NarL/FixJ family response regulator